MDNLTPKAFLHCMIFALCISGLCGCASLKGYPDRAINPEQELAAIKSYLEPGVISNYEKETDPDKRRLLRNEIINARMHAMNLHFGTFEKKLYGEGIGLGVGTDWAALAASGAGGIVSGGAGQAFSLVASGLIGAQSAFSKRAYLEKTIPVIMAEMVAQRAKVEVDIRTGLIKGISEYSLYEGLADLERYYQAGTMTAAIATLAQAAGETAKEAQIELTRVRNKDFVSKATQQKVEDLIAKAAKLTDAAAIDLEKNPPVRDSDVDKIVVSRDPTNQRATNGKVAREMLKMRIAMSGERSDQELSAWEAAVRAAE